MTTPNNTVAGLAEKWRAEADEMDRRGEGTGGAAYMHAEANKIRARAADLEAALASPAPSATVGVGAEIGKLRRLADVLRKHQFIPPASLDQVADNLAALQHPAAPSAPPSVAGDAGESEYRYHGPADLEAWTARIIRRLEATDTNDTDCLDAANLIRRLATAEQPERGLETPRRTAAVKAMIGLGHKWDSVLGVWMPSEQPGSAVQGEVVAWIRFRSDGGWEGPVHDREIDESRRKSGAWTPLYTTPPPAPAAEQGAKGYPDGCAWPDKPFTVRDEPGEHDPCYLVLPSGEMLPFVHHATNGVDQARAKYIADAFEIIEGRRPADATQPEARGVEEMGARVLAAQGSLKAAGADLPSSVIRDAVYAALAAAPSGVRVDDAARALVAKIEAIHADPSYQAVWFCAHNHGQPYTGPNYEAELAALTAALSANEVSRG